MYQLSHFEKPLFSKLAPTFAKVYLFVKSIAERWTGYMPVGNQYLSLSLPLPLQKFIYLICPFSCHFPAPACFFSLSTSKLSTR